MRLRPFEALIPKMDKIGDSDTFFNSLKDTYPQYQSYYEKSTEQAIFIYQIKQNEKSFTGLIACTHIHDYLEGKIKKHEATIERKEKCQRQLMEHRKASIKPVLLTYPPVATISDWLTQYSENHKPLLQVPFAAAEVHSIWQVKEKESIEMLQELFLQQVPTCYIADGHHRSATIARMYQDTAINQPSNPYENLLCAFFDTNQLAVHEFNRVITNINKLSFPNILEQLAQVCDIEKLDQPLPARKKHEFILLNQEDYYRLNWNQNTLKTYAKDLPTLDVMLLNEIILKKILKFRDQSINSDVDYIEGPKGLEGLREKTQANKENLGFQLYPISLFEILQMMDAENMLPPKSTWFEPRMKNGLVVLAH